MANNTMKYKDIRTLIQSGDILAFSGGNWKTWAGIKVNIIRMFTRSTFSHLALAWVIYDRILVVEAVIPKVRIYPLSLLGDFWHIPMDASWLPSTEAYALKCIGIDYVQLTALLGFFKDTKEGNVEQCAALVREILLRDGINLGKRVTPDAVVTAAIERNGMIDFVSNPLEEVK